jgi:hypothetical protein
MSSKRIRVDAADEPSKIVRLNVGGRLYWFAASTLRHSPRGLLRSMMVDGADGAGEVTDESGAIFIDRDPDAFAVVAAYLRTGRALLTSSGDASAGATELDYFFADPPPIVTSAAAAPIVIENAKVCAIDMIERARQQLTSSDRYAPGRHCADSCSLDDACSILFEDNSDDGRGMSMIIDWSSKAQATELHNDDYTIWIADHNGPLHALVTELGGIVGRQQLNMLIGTALGGTRTGVREVDVHIVVGQRTATVAATAIKDDDGNNTEWSTASSYTIDVPMVVGTIIFAFDNRSPPALFADIISLDDNNAIRYTATPRLAVRESQGWRALLGTDVDVTAVHTGTH